ncbi:MAG: M28 family peptidase [Alphaproteobacteria bacterium]|nr:M28 family peptidase [Alphaproteobacteria bacterium]
MNQAPPADLIAAVNAGLLMRHVAEFAKRIKLSGTAEELASFRYLQAELDAMGYATRLILHDAYISLPVAARLDMAGIAPHCITHSFSRPSPEGGLDAEVLYLGVGSPADFAGRDVAGRILLLDGIATPAVSLRASQAGAAGQIHIAPYNDPHEMCISPVWGNPTPETRGNLPVTVVVSVGQADGVRLKAALSGNAPVRATLHAEVDTGWRKTPILEAELFPTGAAADAPFVMFSGHHDTWHFGVMDNGSANATMLEVARIAAGRRGEWQRGLRLCFWSGHSHGRYSGSTWYADTRWDELNRRCVVHVNVDSTGGIGATVLSDTPSAAELRGLAADAVLAQSGEVHAGHRMARAGDESFWGIGIPAMYMGMSEQPAGSTINPAAGVLGGGSRRGAGLGWWWHTPQDTIDKIDPDNLARDTRIYVHTLWRLLSESRLPLDYAETAGDLLGELTALHAKLGDRFDLAGLIARAERLRDAATALIARPAAQDGAVNAALMAIGRALVPLDYTKGDRFDHDPALGLAPWPVLDAMRRLAGTAPEGDDAKFAEVSAIRAANRLRHALDTVLADCG